MLVWNRTVPTECSSVGQPSQLALIHLCPVFAVCFIANESMKQLAAEYALNPSPPRIAALEDISRTKSRPWPESTFASVIAPCIFGRNRASEVAEADSLTGLNT